MRQIVFVHCSGVKDCLDYSASDIGSSISRQLGHKIIIKWLKEIMFDMFITRNW